MYFFIIDDDFDDWCIHYISNYYIIAYSNFGKGRGHIKSQRCTYLHNNEFKRYIENPNVLQANLHFSKADFIELLEHLKIYN